MKKHLIASFALFLCHIAQAQWQQQNSGTNANLNGLQFISATIGFAVGDNGVILKTTDGGSNWVPQTSPTTANLLSIKFVNATTGYITAQDTFFLKSSNGGNSWSIEQLDTIGINPGSCFFCQYNLVDFYDSQNGLIVLSEGQLTNARTTNGGVNWSMKTEGLSAAYTTGISWPVKDTLYILDVNRKLAKSVNGGNSWSETSLATGNVFFYSVNFVNSKIGYVAGQRSGNNRSFINKTTDGGNSWVEVLEDSLPKKRILAMDFDASGFGFAVGNGIILTTNDQGVSWQVDSLTFPSPGQLFAVKITPAGVFAIGSNGKVFADKSVVGISKINRESVLVKVYPNPVKEKTVLVQIDNPEGEYELIIYSTMGEEVFRRYLYGLQEAISLDLTAGLYNYTISFKNRQHHGRLVID